MKLHTNLLTRDMICAALDIERACDRVARTVQFKILNQCGSRSAKRAYEMQLESWDHTPGDGRRRGNDGSYGAMSDGFTATFDEWGWVLAGLYRLDPTMVCGTAKHPVYEDADHYRHRTGFTYELDALLPLLEAGNDPYPYRPAKGYRVGRRGAGRASVEDLAQRPDWAAHFYTWEPRTPESYRLFARL